MPEQSQCSLQVTLATRLQSCRAIPSHDPLSPAQPHLHILLKLQPGFHQFVLKLLSLLLPLLLQGIQWPQLNVTVASSMRFLARLPIGDNRQRVARGAMARVHPTFPVMVGEHIVDLPLVVMEVHTAQTGL